MSREGGRSGRRRVPGHLGARRSAPAHAQPARLQTPHRPARALGDRAGRGDHVGHVEALLPGHPTVGGLEAGARRRPAEAPPARHERRPRVLHVLAHAHLRRRDRSPRPACRPSRRSSRRARRAFAPRSRPSTRRGAGPARRRSSARAGRAEGGSSGTPSVSVRRAVDRSPAVGARTSATRPPSSTTIRARSTSSPRKWISRHSSPGGFTHQAISRRVDVGGGVGGARAAQRRDPRCPRRGPRAGASKRRSSASREAAESHP